VVTETPTTRRKVPPKASPPSPPLVLGLCGAIGSGKSTVARMFAECGAVVVDADRIAHDVLRRKTVKAAIARRWGRDVFRPDGEVDRAALGRVVFADPAEIRALNALTHPLIRKEIARQMAAARARPGTPLIVVDAPLLLESGLAASCDVLAYVAAPAATRAQRVRARHGWSADELARREAQQWPAAVKRAHCHHVIVNAGSLARTTAQVRCLFRKLVSPARPALSAPK